MIGHGYQKVYLITEFRGRPMGRALRVILVPEELLLVDVSNNACLIICFKDEMTCLVKLYYKHPHDIKISTSTVGQVISFLCSNICLSLMTR